MADKKKKKWVKWVIIGAVVIVAGVFFYTTYRASSRAAQELLLSAQKVAVERGDISVVVQASGSLKPSLSTTVYAPLTAEIDELYVENGDTVSKDELLFTLSNDTINDEIIALQTSLTSQDSQLLMADRSKSGNVVSPVSGRVKAIYAVEGQETQAAMQQNNGLILLSADDRMELRFVPAGAVIPGDEVTVIIGEEEAVTTIRSYTNGEATILLEDSAYELGAAASVKAAGGTEIGSGILAVHAPYFVTASEGITDDVRVEINDMVSAGDTLIKLKNSVYSETYIQLLASRQNTLDQLSEKLAQKEQLAVRAPQDGVIENLTAVQGTNVPEGTAIFSIGATDSFELVVAVDELDIASIQLDQTANIALDALAGATYTGKVIRISGTGNYAGGMTTYDVTILLDQTDKILSGMSARADILAASHLDTLLIPVSAIKTIDGEKYVVIMSAPGDKTAASAEGVQTLITVGLSNSSQAEILSGLEEGQYVQDLSASSDSSGFAMFGGQRQDSTGEAA